MPALSDRNRAVPPGPGLPPLKITIRVELPAAGADGTDCQSRESSETTDAARGDQANVRAGDRVVGSVVILRPKPM